jgi:Bacterial transglutaminase-like cysteine proteinase BTLCP
MKIKRSPITYDYYGKRIDSNLINKTLKNSYPIEFYLKSNINYYFNDLNNIHEFLSECEYCSDKEHFGVDDYWMLPNLFESMKKGDCEDFSLYTWRQLINQGHMCRFVIGTVGKNKWHAWCTAKIHKKHYIIDPVLANEKFLHQVYTLNYQPYYSIEFHNDKIYFFQHYSIRNVVMNIYKICVKSKLLLLILSLILAVPFIILYKVTIGNIKLIGRINKYKDR